MTITIIYLQYTLSLRTSTLLGVSITHCLQRGLDCERGSADDEV